MNCYCFYLIKTPAMDTLNTNKVYKNACFTRTPFIIDVNLEEVEVNHAQNKLYSILIDPEKQKTIYDVIKKLKLLFDFKTKFNILSNSFSILPEKETVEILYYLKIIRVQLSGDNFLGPETISQVEGKENCESPSQYKTSISVDANEIVDAVNISENRKTTENKCVNGSKKYTKSFSVGSFLANLRENIEEEPNIPANGDSNISLTSVEQEDCPKKRKRTRRRKKKDVSFEEYESEVCSSKYIKPYSFEKIAHEGAKHMRFNDIECPVNNENSLSGEEILEENVAAQVFVETDVELTGLGALLSLKSPVVYVRTPTISEKE